MKLTIVAIITATTLLLINADEGEEDHGGKLIASIITLADMGFLAWLIA